MTDQHTSASSRPNRPAANLAIPYAICTVLGAGPVFLSTRLVLFPLLVMAFYLAFGLRAAQKQGFALEFADSFYYLGFTLTIASLLASLNPLHPDAKPDPQNVLHFFGLGMFTTLFGVTGRTVLQMFYRAPDESIEVTNRRIAAAGQEFLRHLEELVVRADDAVETTFRAVDAHVHRRADETGAALGDIVGNLRRTASELNGFRLDGSLIDVALGQMTQTVGEFSRRTTESLASVGQASERLAQIAQSARDSTRAAAEGVGQGVTQLAAHVGAAASASERLTRQFERMGNAPERLDSAVAAIAQALESLATRLRDQFGATASGASLVSGALAELSSQISGFSIGDLQVELRRLEAGLQEFRRALEAEGRKPDARVLGDLTAALEQSLGGAKRLNQVLDEIVEAVELKLDRVR
jgi:hypothetical protein